MASPDTEVRVRRYLENAGNLSDSGYRMSAAEVTWLAGALTRLGQLKLELLRGIQTALSRTDDDDAVADLKETLTNVIIMQTRTSGREYDLVTDLERLSDTGRLLDVGVSDDELRQGLAGLVEAADRIGQSGGGTG